MASTINKIIIGVGGGKGGTGKSIVASNLAISLAMANKKVIIVDADLGASNLHSLFGLVTPPKTLDDFVNRNVEDLNSVLIDTAVPNLKLICGGVAMVGLADPTFEQKARLINGINSLDTDYLVVDIGAGSSLTSVDFYNNAHIKILVFSAQLTSLQNGYGFLKTAVYQRITRALRRKYGTQDKRLDSLDVLVRNADQVKNILQVLEKLNPEYRATVEQELKHYNTFIIGNMFREENSRDTLLSMQTIIRDYLNLQADILGVLSYRQTIHDSINRMKPFMLTVKNKSDVDYITFLNVAKKVLHLKIDLALSGQDNFFQAGKYDEQYKADAAPGAKPPTDGHLLPDELIKSMLEDSQRKSTGLAAQLFTDTQVVDVVIKQISMKGVLVLTPKGWTYDKAFERIRIFIDGDGLTFLAKAVVVDANKSLVGFRFRDITRLKTIVLYELISQL